MRRLGASLLVLALAGPLQAGVLDDIKSGASSVRDSIQDVKSTKDETKGVVTDADDLADETANDVKSALPDTQPAEPAQPAAGAAAPPPPPSAVAAPPPPPSATQWHIDLGAGQTRAVNQSELAGLIRSGQVSAQTPVFTESLGAWKPAGEVPALASYFAR
ncbi:MAG TPA: DUF4339 domain-containing protein [Myxococcota bacterium]|nr:DUF4339 domain-containing protein [Myxococcota bacterium]